MNNAQPDEQGWVPPGVDASVPNVARIYDYLLGGKDNYTVDRVTAEQVLDEVPMARVEVRHNRAFLSRAVRYLVGECGIRQFLDIGTGLPTGGNVHEVAHAVAPDARVVYVDNDPVVIAHAQALLAGDNKNVTVVQADLRQPETILDDPATRELIDFTQPLAVLLVAVLHFVVDDAAAYRIVGQLRDAAAGGSYVAVTHATPDQADAADRVEQVYQRANSPGRFRPREQIASFFDGLQLVEPGLVRVADWRPDVVDPDLGGQYQESGSTWILGGVGRRP